jgi:hypothetical protein
MSSGRTVVVLLAEDAGLFVTSLIAHNDIVKQQLAN